MCARAQDFREKISSELNDEQLTRAPFTIKLRQRSADRVKVLASPLFLRDRECVEDTAYEDIDIRVTSTIDHRDGRLQ